MASQKFGFVTVDPVSGSGDQAVNFSGEKHTGRRQRTINLTVATNGGAKKALVVNQAAAAEVTDQPLTVSPGSGTGNAAVSFGSVMNKGLDRTLELEITTPKGVKKTLAVNQEGCRQAYITSDGKRWLTSDNRVYGVLKSDAPC